MWGNDILQLYYDGMVIWVAWRRWMKKCILYKYTCPSYVCKYKKIIFIFLKISNIMVKYCAVA